MKEVTIPRSVKSLGREIFAECNQLEKVIFKDGKNLSEDLNDLLGGFNFNSFLTNGNELIFVRNIEKERIDEKE